MKLKRFKRKCTVLKRRAQAERLCTHFDMDLDKKVRSKLLFSVMQEFTCEVHEGRKCENLWFCTRCDQTHCGDNKRSGKPPDFPKEHMEKSGHPLIMQSDSNEVLWCFLCGRLISVALSAANKTHGKSTRKNVQMITGDPTQDVTGPCRYHVRGMINERNICYYNALVQNLLSFELLRDHFAKATKYAPGSFGHLLKDLYAATDQHSGKDIMKFEHKALLNRILNEYPDQFHEDVQGDSEELLLALFRNLTAGDASQRVIEDTFGLRSMETRYCECGLKNTYELHRDDFILVLSIPSIHKREKGNWFTAVANKMTGRSGKIKTKFERGETPGKDLEPQRVDTEVDDVPADKESGSADVSKGAVRGSQRDDTSKGSDSDDVSEKAVEGNDTSKAEKGSDTADVSKAAGVSEEAVEGHGGDDKSRNERDSDSADVSDAEAVAKRKEKSVAIDDGERAFSIKIPKLFKKRTNSSEGKPKPDDYVVDDTNGKISVARLLANMMWTKESDTDRFCSCKKSCVGRPAFVSFTKAPIILVMHLLRYRYQYGVDCKIHGHVAFKETMIYGQAALEGSSDAIDVIYQLKGVVEHIGNYKAGHYVAYVKGGVLEKDGYVFVMIKSNLLLWRGFLDARPICYFTKESYSHITLT